MENSKNKARYSALAAPVLILAAVLTLFLIAACKPMFLQDIAGYVPVYSQVVGPDGGTVTDSRGASVEIPAGALAEETTITIATYSDGGDIYSCHGVTPFTGGADFGPDGIEFLKPVTITLPSARRLVPGQTQPLFMLDPDTGAWDMTGFTLTAAEDGWSATAEVTHFTPYVMSLLPPDALSKIEEFFDGTNGQAALGSYMAWFLTATNLYGYTTECSDSTYEVVGLFFDFTWQVDGVPGTAVSQYGDVSLDTVAQLNYSYDTASTDGPEYIYNMLVTVYFDVTENPPEADPSISILEPVPGSTVEGIETISTYIVTGDSGTDIESVAFYADGSILGSDTEAPFQWYWDTLGYADGEHVLTATASFSDGKSVESEPVTVVFGDGGEEEPGLATGDNRSFEIAGVGFDMKFISDGITFLTGWDDNGDLNQFEVGVEVDPPEVTIENAYWIGETEVTFELWDTVYLWATGDTNRDGVISGSETAGNYTFSPGQRGGGFTPDSDQHPVTAVDWRDAIAWCNALTDYYNSQNGTQYGYVYCTDSSFSTPIRSVDNSSSVSYPNPGSQDDPYVNENAKGFRLPGLHEWGCAARYIGDFNQDGDITDSGEYYPGNFASGADADADTPQAEMTTDYDGDNDIEGWWDVAVLDVGVTSAVTSKSPNAIGLHDMTGNVLEWCFSWFPSREGEWRTARGGSWHNHFCSSEIGYVVPGGPHSAEDFLGFRIVKNE